MPDVDNVFMKWMKEEGLNKMKKKLLAIILTVVMTMPLLAGCGGSSDHQEPSQEDSNTAADDTNASDKDSGETAAAKGETTETGEKVHLKILMPFYDAEHSSSIVAALEEAANVELEIVGAAYDQWDQKVNTLMSVGEEYDIIIINTTTPYQTWASEGLVVNLDEIVDPERHPYTYKLINSDMYGAYAVDGAHYFMPGVHQGQDFATYIRQDILDELGIEKVETIDQFYEAAKYAKEKYDMYAWTGSSSEGNFEQFQALFGAFGCGSVHPSERGFIVQEDGTVVESSCTEAAKNALIFLNTLYREGMVNKDYLTVGDASRDTYVASGKSLACYVDYGSMNAISSNLKLVDEDAYMIATEPFNQDIFVGRLGWGAMWTMAFISETSENPAAALDFFEFVNSKEGRDICCAGPAGLTCTEEGVSADGVYTPIAENVEKEWGSPSATSPMWASFMTTTFGYIPAADYDTFEEAYENRIIYITASDLENNNPYCARNGLRYGGMYAESSKLNTTALPIETEVKNTLNDLRAEYWNKIIMEQDPNNIDALWDEFVEKWKTSGGTEYEAAYQEFYDTQCK